MNLLDKYHNFLCYQLILTTSSGLLRMNFTVKSEYRYRYKHYRWDFNESSTNMRLCPEDNENCLGFVYQKIFDQYPD